MITNFGRIPLERARLRRDLGHFERSFWRARLVKDDESDVGCVWSLVVPQSDGIISLVGPLGRAAHQHQFVFRLLECDPVVVFYFFWSLESQRHKFRLNRGQSRWRLARTWQITPKINPINYTLQPERRRNAVSANLDLWQIEPKFIQ